jgi:hypothetical protein
MNELRHAPDLDVAIGIVAAAIELEAIWRERSTFDGTFTHDTRTIIDIFCAAMPGEREMKTEADFRRAHRNMLDAIDGAKEYRAKRERDAADLAAQLARERTLSFKLKKWLIYVPLLLLASALGGSKT